MTFDENYYREELDYLRQLGKLLAREKPHLAHFLADKENDPDVEQLLEAFALFSGDLRKKLEDDFPEMTHGIIKRTFPNYLRPVPSMTVIEYSPLPAQHSTPVKIFRGEIITSGVVRPTSAGRKASDRHSHHVQSACHFTLARDVWLQPLRIKDIHNRSTLQEGIIEIDFFTEKGTSPAVVDLNKLTFWLGNEDNYTRYQLYLWFCERLMDAELDVGGHSVSLPNMWLKATGFEREDTLLPWEDNEMSGYRILHEYFCFPENFLFFRIENAAPLPTDLSVDFFTLRLKFNQPLPANINLHRESLRPYCTPAINLFPRRSEPLAPGRKKKHFPLHVSLQNQDAYDIFQVKAVFSQIPLSKEAPGSTERTRFWPEFGKGLQKPEYYKHQECIYWHHHPHNTLFHSVIGDHISFTYGDGSQPKDPHLNNVITASLICTNRSLPETLAIGHICVSIDKNPARASFRNIIPPTPYLEAVTNGEMHWSLISSMKSNYLYLLDKEGLVQLLTTLDRPGIEHPHQARLSNERLAAIEKMETYPIDRLIKGVPVRGISTILWINPTAYSFEGEIYLFGNVLSHLFAQYASTHAFHCLKMINTRTQEQWEWQHTGQHSLM